MSNDYHDGTIIYTTRRRPDTDRMALLLNAEYELKDAMMHSKSMLRSVRAAGGHWGMLATHLQEAMGTWLQDALEFIEDEIREEQKDAKHEVL